MGPYYDSIYLMVRQLPEPPEHHREAEMPGSATPNFAWRSVTTAARARLRNALFVELPRVLKQPLRRSWASE